MTRTINAHNPERPICKAAEENCTLEAFTKGYCENHYKRWKRSGSPYGPAGPERTPSTCQATEDNCDRPVKGYGYCTLHYYRFKTNGSPYVVKKPVGRPPVVRHLAPICKAKKDNCDRRAVTKGYCQKHYDRVRRHGDPYTVITNYPRENASTKKAGMVEVYFPIHDAKVSVLDAFAGAMELLPTRLARRGLRPKTQPAFAIMDGLQHKGSGGAPFLVVARLDTELIKSTWRNPQPVQEEEEAS